MFGAFVDIRGLMWFATDKGVTCYNGLSIVNMEWEDKHIRRVVDIKEDARVDEEKLKQRFQRVISKENQVS